MEEPDQSPFHQVISATVPYLSAAATRPRSFAACLGLLPILFSGSFLCAALPAPFSRIAAFSTIFVYKWSLDYFRRTWICSTWVPWLAHAYTPLQYDDLSERSEYSGLASSDSREFADVECTSINGPWATDPQLLPAPEVEIAFTESHIKSIHSPPYELLHPAPTEGELLLHFLDPDRYPCQFPDAIIADDGSSDGILNDMPDSGFLEEKKDPQEKAKGSTQSRTNSDNEQANPCLRRDGSADGKPVASIEQGDTTQCIETNPGNTVGNVSGSNRIIGTQIRTRTTAIRQIVTPEAGAREETNKVLRILRKQNEMPFQQTSAEDLSQSPGMGCDSPSASEDELSSCSEDGASQYAPPKRPSNSMHPPERPRMHSDRPKRYLYQGSDTSGIESYTVEVNKQSRKGKERSVSSGTGGSSSSHPQLLSSAASRHSRGRESETDATSFHLDAGDESKEDDNVPDQDGDEEDEDASDDDFGKLPIQISNVDPQDTQAMSENAVLDTGTKVDWISQMFYKELKTLGVKSSKLSQEDTRKEYRDFNGNRFQPLAKVDLMIQSEEFKGLMKCRKMSFFVANKATFSILIGRDTIKKHKLMTRGERDTDGEGVFVGIHGGPTEAEKAEMKRKREEHNKMVQERKKAREAKTEGSARRKDNVNTSSKVAAHLATTVSRRSKTRSPSKTAKKSLRQSEIHSDSSLEATW